jgi:hypothetical protein
LPPEVQPLLDEFPDVVLEDIPPRLHLITDIQHCIDFILGVILRNKVAYRISPIEHAKSQR